MSETAMTGEIEALVAQWRDAMSGVTAGPWYSESVDTEGSYGSGEDTTEGFKSYVVRTEARKHYGEDAVICDAMNSGTAEVHEEFDEDGVNAWDEPGRCNMAWVARCSTEGVSTLLDALARLTAELARLSDPLAVHINMVRGAIAKPSIENIRHIYPEIAQGEFEARCALRAAEARALTAEAERDQLKIGNRVLDELVAEHCGKRLTAEAALAKAVEALEPFANCIFNDNGDITVNFHAFTSEELIAAYFARKAIRARSNGESP